LQFALKARREPLELLLPLILRVEQYATNNQLKCPKL
jgi:hypothetical protein